MKREHYDLIIAWANGAKIQYWSKYKKDWTNVDTPLWDINGIYRIKPNKSISDFDKHTLATVKLVTNNTRKVIKILDTDYTDSDNTKDYILGIIKNYDTRDVIVEINPKSGHMFTMNGKSFEENAIVVD